MHSHPDCYHSLGGSRSLSVQPLSGGVLQLSYPARQILASCGERAAGDSSELRLAG